MFKRDRAMLSMRVAVTGALACYLPLAGSAAIDDAVDEALARIYAGGHHRGPGEEVLAHWINGARWLLIDDWRSSARHRDPVDVNEHAQALTVAVCGDLVQLTEDARLRWRIREILSVLSGNQRIWAEALYDEVLARRKTGVQPRGLPDVLGWNEEKTRKTAWRARQNIAKFMAERASGVICAEQRALLGAFIAATNRPYGEQLPTELDQQRYEQLIFHLAGCENCWAAWIVRRATPRQHLGAIVVWPWGAAHALGAKLMGVGIGAHAAALSAKQRVVGGGAIAGGGAATLGSKTAAVCVAGACAVGAGAGAGGEIAGALSPIVGLQRAQHTVRKHPAHRRAMPRARPVNAAAAPSSPTVQRTTVVRTAPAPAVPVAPEERFTPGDLPPASSTSAESSSAPGADWSSSAHVAPPPPPPPTAAASSGGGARCIPGDLAC
jgi:DNA-directed RNA polymerase specialized sigma24 family protein